MKALTLLQPWAELIVSGRKTIETRRWNTAFRGEFFIHAGKDDSCYPDMKQFGYARQDLTFGALIGKATLVSVKKYTSKMEFLADGPKHLAVEFFEDDEALIRCGKIHGFVLEGIKRLDKPIPCGGMLNFWETNKP